MGDKASRRIHTSRILPLLTPPKFLVDEIFLEGFEDMLPLNFEGIPTGTEPLRNIVVGQPFVLVQTFLEFNVLLFRSIVVPHFKTIR